MCVGRLGVRPLENLYADHYL